MRETEPSAAAQLAVGDCPLVESLRSLAMLITVFPESEWRAQAASRASRALGLD